MSHKVLIDWKFHQGCLINGHKCRVNEVYEGCTKCPRYKPEIIINDSGY